MVPPRLLLLVSACSWVLRAADEPATRTWTDLKGRTLEVELTGVDATGRALLRIFDKPVPVDPKTLVRQTAGTSRTGRPIRKPRSSSPPPPACWRKPPSRRPRPSRW